MDFFGWNGWIAVEALSTLVASFSVLFAFLSYHAERRNTEKQKRLNAAWVTAWMGKHNGENAVVIENDSRRTITEVAVIVHGAWLRSNAHRQKSPDDVTRLPGKASTWSLIPPGLWAVVPRDDYPAAHPCPIAKGLEDGEWVPNYGDKRIYIQELSYTDYRGERWVRKAIEDNPLVLGMPEPVNAD